MDYIRRLVRVNGEAVHLTPIEDRILVMLSRNAGKVLTHEALIREWEEHDIAKYVKVIAGQFP